MSFVCVLLLSCTWDVCFVSHAGPTGRNPADGSLQLLEWSMAYGTWLLQFTETSLLAAHVSCPSMSVYPSPFSPHQRDMMVKKKFVFSHLFSFSFFYKSLSSAWLTTPLLFIWGRNVPQPRCHRSSGRRCKRKEGERRKEMSDWWVRGVGDWRERWNKEIRWRWESRVMADLGLILRYTAPGCS